jgi:putative two-component system response regulator
MATMSKTKSERPGTNIDLDETLHSLGLERVTSQEVGGQRDALSLNDDVIRKSKIMIVDDEAYNVLVVRKFLQHTGYTNFITTTESPKAIDLMRRDLPDVVLLDIMMPDISGLEILRCMKMDAELATIPVIILTAAPEASVKTQALQLGAIDFLSKPVEPTELILRVRNVLAAKSHFDSLANYSVELEKQVRDRTKELVESRQQIIYCLARASEFRDNETGHHVIRVGKFAGIIAAEMGFTTGQVEAIELAAQLHDVGKIGIPDRILHKPGKLDPEEFAFIHKHCGFGKQIIACMPENEWNVVKQHTELGSLMVNVKTSPIMRMASRIALTHHEWFDGTGYPLGLEGEDIPIEGRITAVADVFDALSSSRVYKKAFSRQKCFKMIEEKRGSQFDPQVLDAFYNRAEEIVEVKMRYADTE